MRQQRLLLIVDDDEMVCEVIRQGLTADGYAIQIAVSGQQALDLCGASRFDLAVVDLLLRGPIGGEAVGAALTRLGIPVIMMSGALEGEERLSKFPYPFLLKPFFPSTLRALVEETLAGRS